MTGRLAGKVAIVTGGASGFGVGIARCFAHEGARVLIADRDATGGEAVAESLRGEGADAAACAADVTDRASVASMVAAAGDAFGAVDILVANAGIGQRPSPFEETPDETIDQLYAVNVKGVMNCCREVIPLFRGRGRGNIIVTASGIALIPRPNFAAYAASKGAVVALAKALALELASDGIRVNALCPAVGDTPMLAEFAGGEVADEERAGFGSILPLGKLITPEDVGHAAVFLASDVEAGNITGCALPVDGGRCV
ncbi:MAG: glucose 1-dehydrogenase [Hyphomicrobiales bacterium]